MATVDPQSTKTLPNMAKLDSNCGTGQRFKNMGMKFPAYCFPPKATPSSRVWGAEPLYNPTTLVGNWYEDRRAYMRLCPRFTGTSIMKTDYVPICIERNTEVPPPNYAQRLRDRGGDPRLLMNTEDYCDYMQNYTTTYDLMHNWEVRRAGIKPVPWRRWRQIQGSSWTPERDNAVSFGNLTQIGYRKAPQLPLLPNDWDLYANSPTSNQVDFPPPRYPDHYVHCRIVPPRAIREENEELVLIRSPDACTPDACGRCKDDTHPCDKPCRCVCHAVEQAILKPNKKSPPNVPRNIPRFGKYIPAGRFKHHEPIQNLNVTSVGNPYGIPKRQPHLPAGPCKPDCAAYVKKGDLGNPFRRPDICNDYAGDVGKE